MSSALVVLTKFFIISRQRRSQDFFYCNQLFELKAQKVDCNRKNLVSAAGANSADKLYAMIVKENMRGIDMSLLRNIIARDWRPGRAATAGLIATLAYSVAMEGDRFLTGNYFNDVRFIEGLLVGEKRDKRFFVLAWLIHLLNGIALAQIYAAVAKRFLPGPDWLKGAIFGEAFIATAWSLTPLADRYHPLIKHGKMPRLATRRSFMQNLVRHLVFGLVLGCLY